MTAGWDSFDLRAFGLAALVGLAALGFGRVYFALLRRSVGLFVGARRTVPAVALAAGRLAAAVLLFWLAARLGPLPLLAAFGGFLLARRQALRQG